MRPALLVEGLIMLLIQERLKTFLANRQNDQIHMRVGQREIGTEQEALAHDSASGASIGKYLIGQHADSHAPIVEVAVWWLSQHIT